jgi:hypothetical protein
VELIINNQKVEISAGDAEALHRALGYHLKRMIGKCPNLPRTPVVKRLMLISDDKWEKTQADIQPSRSGQFTICVGTFKGEVSRAEMLRLWKHLEKAAGDATGDLLDLADSEFMDDLFRTKPQ